MRKRCRRTVYPLVNPITHATEGARTVPQDGLNKLRLRELSAIESFAKGCATRQDLADMEALLVVTETIALQGVGHTGVLQACRVAEQHLIDAARRAERIGRIGLTGPGLESIRALFRHHDEQRAPLALSVYEQLIRKATHRLKSRAPKGVAL